MIAILLDMSQIESFFILPKLQRQTDAFSTTRSLFYNSCRNLHRCESNNGNVVDGNEGDGSEKTSKSSRFDRIVDDFIGKRFGAGEVFYGKKLSSLSDSEYDSLRGSGVDKIKEYSKKPLRSNAVLLVGDVDVGVGEWIVYDLYEKGFNIRVAACDARRVIDR